jgi:hypothetical protein
VAFPRLDLTERHFEQHLPRPTGLDGSVAVVKMPRALRAEPDGEGAAALERFVKGTPVPDMQTGGVDLPMPPSYQAEFTR